MFIVFQCWERYDHPESWIVLRDCFPKMGPEYLLQSVGPEPNVFTTDDPSLRTVEVWP